MSGGVHLTPTVLDDVDRKNFIFFTFYSVGMLTHFTAQSVAHVSSRLAGTSILTSSGMPIARTRAHAYVLI